MVQFPPLQNYDEFLIVGVKFKTKQNAITYMK